MNNDTEHRLMLQKQFKFELFADFHQFYVMDAGINPQAPDIWTNADVSHRALAADHIVVICPIRNMTVPVTLELYEAEPNIDLAPYDHAVRCSLDLPTGQLQVHECTGGETLRQAVTPGLYAVLALYSGLNTIDEMGLEGDDAYRLVLWPTSAEAPLTVLKMWVEPSPF